MASSKNYLEYVLEQLSELNDGITELAGENQQLRKRVTDLRAKIKNAGI